MKNHGSSSLCFIMDREDIYMCVYLSRDRCSRYNRSVTRLVATSCVPKCASEWQRYTQHLQADDKGTLIDHAASHTHTLRAAPKYARLIRTCSHQHTQRHMQTHAHIHIHQPAGSSRKLKALNNFATTRHLLALSLSPPTFALPPTWPTLSKFHDPASVK